MNLLDVVQRTPGYWYLATPYSKYALGLEQAFQDAARAAGLLIRNGVRVYSPIAHTHPIAMAAGIDPLCHAIWLPADLPMMQAAAGLLVLRMPGFTQSYGIREEIKEFFTAKKPIYAVDWPIESVPVITPLPGF